MAAKEDDLTLEFSLNLATNPANREEDWDSIGKFCDLVNKELEGPSFAVRLLAHKVQSPQEREALYALATIESCIKSCGKRFHQEIGKFRFLNEIIKVISPKYLGSKTGEKVKKRCIELMYSWQKGLPHEPKIAEAYAMLKEQGVVKQDPTYMDKEIHPIPKPLPEEDRRAAFEDEEKSKLLAKLLKSKNPEDLQAANRLIKNMVKQDTEKMEKVSRRINELETIHLNVNLLQEMVAQYNPASSSESDKEMMKELYESLEKLRPKLFRLASEVDESDTDGLNTILKANDEVSNIMKGYKITVEGIDNDKDGEKKDELHKFAMGGNSLLDLGNDQTGPVPPAVSQPEPSLASSLLDDEMLSLGLQSPKGSLTVTSNGTSDNLMSDLDDIFSSTPVSAQQAAPSFSAQVPISQPGFPLATSMPGFPMASQTTSIPGFNQPLTQPGLSMAPSAVGINPMMPAAPASINYTSVTSTPGQVSVFDQKPVQASTGIPSVPPTKAMQDLESLGQSLLQQNLADSSSNYMFNAGPKQPAGKVTLNQLSSGGAAVTVPVVPVAPQSTPVNMLQPSLALASHPPPVSTVTGSSTTTISSPTTPKLAEVQPLTDVFVPLESIQPGTAAPVNAYDKNGLKILIHVAKDCPRDDVSVMVISVISTNATPLKAFVFQAAVPKVMKVKLQPPSATDLPAFNPILPPSAITQVMLLANPHKEKIRLKYKVSYTMEEKAYSDVGDIDGFSV